jgi:hypothetical protein
MVIKAKYIIIGGAILGIGALWYNSKINRWKEAMTKLKAVPTGLRNFDINFKRMRFNLDVTLYNPTNESFNPDGIIAVVKRIVLKDKLAKKFATITVNRSFISLPAKGKLELKDLIVEIPILENISNWQNLTEIKSVNDIQIETILNVMGKEYSIFK